MAELWKNRLRRTSYPQPVALARWKAVGDQRRSPTPMRGNKSRTRAESRSGDYFTPKGSDIESTPDPFPASIAPRTSSSPARSSRYSLTVLLARLPTALQLAQSQRKLLGTEGRAEPRAEPQGRRAFCSSGLGGPFAFGPTNNQPLLRGPSRTPLSAERTAARMSRSRVRVTSTEGLWQVPYMVDANSVSDADLMEAMATDQGTYTIRDLVG